MASTTTGGRAKCSYGARFRKPVVPGDTLHIHVEKRYNRGNVWKFKGEARVGDTVMADATFAAMIVET
ncbi:MAG: hypothetical protein IH807_05600 [Proteobacteria bacterium]|nr:hypothetical protein [Pseudomonadota bacterium]